MVELLGQQARNPAIPKKKFFVLIFYTIQYYLYVYQILTSLFSYIFTISMTLRIELKVIRKSNKLIQSGSAR